MTDAAAAAVPPLARGFWRRNRWLVLRRASQALLLAVFLTGPWFGLWITKGNLNHSLTFDVLPLTDLLVLLQTLAARHVPEATALAGAAIVAVFYALAGGRVFCSWVCPVNPVTDAAHRLRRALGLRSSTRFPRSARTWILGMVLVLSAATGTIAWELVNPVSMVHRGLVFGMGAAWLVVLAVFLFDLFVMDRGWCGHLCPVGACYALVGRVGLVRMAAPRRRDCDDCMDCYAVCPEPHVLPPALKGEARGASPLIASADCTNCGRCADVCTKDVFAFATRFSPQTPAPVRTLR